MGQADNWGINFAGTEEGLQYAEVAGVRIYDARGLFPLAQYADGAVEKIGYTVHHDAVAFAGFTIAEELGRMRQIDEYHRDHNGWPGIGYHRVIAPSGRVYLVGSSATQRAHVANLNHLWIGYCFLGNFTSSRPSEAAMHALRTALQWETDKRGVSMLLRPHKALTAGTECPGGWAAADAWATIRLVPGAPAPVPPPPAPPAPAPSLKQQILELVNQLPD